MALQRKNFRCPRDGLASPIRVSGSPRGTSVVISHAELPPRQRKRLQVGATNLCKSASAAEFDASRDDLDAARRVCATNIELLAATKVTAAAGNEVSIGASSSERAREGDAHVVRTEFRRLHSMTPSSSASRLEERNTRRSSHGARATLTRLEALSHPDQPPSPLTTTTNTVDTTAERDANARRREQSDAKSKKQRAQFVKNRKLLYEAFVKKYGSMRAVFKAFDSDGDGVISFQRFANMVEASEVGLSPEETRAMYAHVDANGDNAMEFQEFAQMFAASEFAGNHSADKTGDDGCITSDPGSSYALKYRSPLELSPRSRERMKELRSKVNAQLAELHGLDVNIHGGKNAQLLMYAFKQFDSDNDGVLSYEQAKSALGKDFLKLQMQPAEMEEMIHMIDHNGDELISMKEFVQYFGVGKREIPTDLLDNGRKKALTALHHKMDAKLTPRDEVDPEYFAKHEPVAVEEEPTRGVVDTAGCLPENLSKRIAAAPIFQTPPSPSRVLSGSKSVPTLGSLRDRSGGGGESLSPSRGPEVNPISPVDQDRFQHRRKQRTDWTRVGLGSDGVARDSGLFLSELERFRTTAADAYSPMRRGQNSGDLSREQRSTSMLEFEAREKTRQARFERAQTQLQQNAANHAQEERLRDWKQRANVRKAAGIQFAYLDRIHDQEQRAAMKDLQPQKRHGGARYLRMWAGSPDSQFNALRVGEDEG